jgi:hypothetical protein
MKKFLKIIKFLQEYLNGDFAYKKYLENFNKHQHEEKALSKENFLRKRNLQKTPGARCC